MDHDDAQDVWVPEADLSGLVEKTEDRDEYQPHNHEEDGQEGYPRFAVSADGVDAERQGSEKRTSEDMDFHGNLLV